MRNRGAPEAKRHKATPGRSSRRSSRSRNVSKARAAQEGNDMSRKVYVIGVGMTKFEKLLQKPWN